MKCYQIVFIGLIGLSNLTCFAESDGVSHSNSDQETGAVISKWLEKKDRKKLACADCEMINQDGKPVKLGDFTGKPIAISFVYTRCTNSNKCQAVGRSAVDLNDQILKLQPRKDLVVLLITYDPDFDSPSVLKEWGTQQGIHFSDCLMMLKYKPEDRPKVINAFNLKVNYEADRVSIHRLQMILLDKAGRIARSFHSTLWNNGDVIKDLLRLSSEDGD
jgi:protein SCO1/2